MAPVGVWDSNEAEFLATVFALEVSLEKIWLKDGEIIVESDSENALLWLRTKKVVCGISPSILIR